MNLLYVLLLLSIIAIVVAGGVFLALDQGRVFLAIQDYTEAYSGLVSCKNHSYLELKNDALYTGGTYTYGLATCVVGVSAQGAGIFDIDVSSELSDGTITEAESQIDLSSSLIVNSYEEVVN